MTVAAHKLRVGEVVEVEGRLYDVIPNKEGGATLEPAITVSAQEIIRRSGGRPATPDEIQQFFGELPSDGEG